MRTKILKKTILLTSIILTGLSSIAQSDLCDNHGPDATNQRIQQKIYENIRILHKLKPGADVGSLQIEYTDLRTSFNALYRKMTDDLGLFTGKKKVCKAYAGELKALVDKAETFNTELIVASGRQKPAALGVDDLLSIVDWIIKNVGKWGEDKRTKFYTALEWDEWAVVLDPSKKAKAPVTQSDSSTTPKPAAKPTKPKNNG